MAQNSKLFNFAGTSRHSNGELKVRFGQDVITRLKVNVKRQNEEINFYELPQPMQKRQACEYLLANVELTEEQRFALTARIGDLKRIERREAKARGELKVVGSAEELLKALGKRERVK